jgi:hypothetical protein
VKSYATLDQKPGPGQYEVGLEDQSRVKGFTIG